MLPCRPRGAQVILKHDPCVLDMPDAGGNVALHAAARTGHAGILRHLLELKPETLDMQNLDSRWARPFLDLTREPSPCASAPLAWTAAAHRGLGASACVRAAQ